MIGVGSKRAIATAHAWVLTSKFFFLAKGHLEAKTVPE